MPGVRRRAGPESGARVRAPEPVLYDRFGADPVVDAERLASGTGRDSKRGLSEVAAGKALDGVVEAAAALNGDDVTVDGFGSFSTSSRSARTGRNPQTGKEAKTAAGNVVEFNTGAERSKSVDEAGGCTRWDDRWESWPVEPDRTELNLPE